MKVREAELTDAFSIAKVNIDSWRNTDKGIIADEYLNNLNYEKKEQAMKNIIINSTKDKNMYLLLKIIAHPKYACK
ncbi:hypothetical protein [Sedimentibacter sp. MB31-C6]|uniref:hypothetical protein n=1 Tax=Sedimentibacter sp. MB31-C6 TaxID=3109366 RepID=UPI002DDD326C|nr:hypothetical protein [Sedimentibacter sp. MB36-C1]WSI05157.1 hypothetical protein U8307_05030 [Sedimentibacter sp. MB36-C1]